jgi:uncharacterized phage protein (TIGR02220 family)
MSLAKKPYVVLDAEILSSSVWSESASVRLVWITLLILCDMDGYVGASLPGIARAAGVSLEEAAAAIERFQQPDPHSRTQALEGRRLAVAERGFQILNFIDHLNRLSSERTKARDRMRRHRQRKAIATSCDAEARDVTPVTSHVPQGVGNREQIVGSRKKGNNNGQPSLRSEVDEVFTYWQDVMGHSDSRLGKDRVRVIEARLKEGYTVDQIKAAVDGCKASAWHMGENERRKRYDGLELICRSAEKLDAFRAAVPVKSPDVPLPPAPTAEQQEASRREWERIRPTLGVAK